MQEFGMKVDKLVKEPMYSEMASCLQKFIIQIRLCGEINLKVSM